MPIDPKTYQNDKEEFDKTVEAVFNEELSDEEIEKELDENLGKRDPDEAGEATGDQEPKPAKTEDAKIDPDDHIKTGQDDDPATSGVVKPEDGDDGVDWKAKATELEAELAKEKQKTSSWNGRITAANNRVKELEAEVAQLKASKPDEPAEDDKTKEVLEKFSDSFPELKEVVDVMLDKIDVVEKKVAPAAAVDPEPDSHTTDDNNVPDTSHRDAILKEHKELDEIAGTGVLSTWIEGKDDYIKPYLRKVYASGTAQEVITMITEFKKQTGWKSQLTGEADKTKEDKLKTMLEVDSQSGGPVDNTGPDKDDYEQGAKDAGL